MRTNRRRLKQPEKIPFGKFVVVTLLAVVLDNCLAFVHAGFAVANILLALSLCFMYFKRAVPVRFRKSVSAVWAWRSGTLPGSASTVCVRMLRRSDYRELKKDNK